MASKKTEIMDEELWRNNLGEILSNLKEQNPELTNIQIAGELGVGRNTISYLIQKKGTPMLSGYQLYRLCMLHDISAREILGIDALEGEQRLDSYSRRMLKYMDLLEPTQRAYVSESVISIVEAILYERHTRPDEG